MSSVDIWRVLRVGSYFLTVWNLVILCLMVAWSNPSIDLHGPRSTVPFGDKNIPVSFSFLTQSPVVWFTPVTLARRSKNDFDPVFCFFSNVSETLKVISLALED